jgi:hypothetical protein
MFRRHEWLPLVFSPNLKDPPFPCFNVRLAGIRGEHELRDGIA